MFPDSTPFIAVPLLTLLTKGIQLKFKEVQLGKSSSHKVE